MRLPNIKMRSKPKNGTHAVFDDLDRYLAHQDKCGKQVSTVALFDFQIDFGLKHGHLIKKGDDILTRCTYTQGPTIIETPWDEKP